MARHVLACPLLFAAVLAAFPAGATAARWGPEYFPDVLLVDQDGAKVRFYDDLLRGKVVVVDLIYTHCQYSCPLQTARLAQVQRLLGERVGKDVHFLSITLDPRRDTPEVLKAYAERYRVGPGWRFVTGAPADVKLVAEKLGLVRDGPPVNADGHTPELMIGDVARGQWMRNSAVDDPRLLARTIITFLDGYGPGSPGSSYLGAAAAKPVSKGEWLFRTRCAACHGIGDGDHIGPDLAGVTTARERSWLVRFIARPNEVLAEGDPVARGLHARYGGVNMPNLGLGDADVSSLLTFLEAKGRGVGPPGTRGGSGTAPVTPGR